MPRTIIVTFTAERYWTVAEGDRMADSLCWDEMLGHFATLTMPTGGRLYPMLTAEQIAERERRYVDPVESECDDWSSTETHVPF